MQLLQHPDPTVAAILGHNRTVHDGDLIRPSLYALPFEIDGHHILYHTLTGQLVEVDNDHHFENHESFVYYDDSEEITALLKDQFFVRDSYDETSTYETVLAMLRSKPRKQNGYTGYTILPTTACNARCFYCYEQGVSYETMIPETVHAVIDYIKKTRQPDAPIVLDWFGGEPLIGASIIDQICTAMRDDNIKYTSSMISNGSLFTPDMISKAVEIWHLRTVQITLDGREEEYNSRKEYVSLPGSPYKTVIQNIHSLLKHGIRVSIRLNLDEDNYEDLLLLIDELSDEFSEGPKPFIYPHLLFAYGESRIISKEAALQKLSILQDKIQSVTKGWRETTDNKPRRSEQRHHTKVYYCLSDSPASAPVILPDGRLELCEHIGQLMTDKTVFDEPSLLNKERYLTRNRTKDEKCKTCPFLPECTDFSSCPNCDWDCKREREIKRRDWIARFIHRTGFTEE